ncbi:MAG: hypothetical protein AAF724_22445 [Pseudomonadota bacterium]
MRTRRYRSLGIAGDAYLPLLIGGGGLGKVILEALQFAAKGPGLLGGFAILFVAMVIDRIVQGAFRRADQK